MRGEEALGGGGYYGSGAGRTNLRAAGTVEH